MTRCILENLFGLLCALIGLCAGAYAAIGTCHLLAPDWFISRLFALCICAGVAIAAAVLTFLLTGSAHPGVRKALREAIDEAFNHPPQPPTDSPEHASPDETPSSQP